MKTAKLKVFIVAVLICCSVHAEAVDVSIEKYSPDLKLLGLSELPSGTCVKKDTKSTCNISPETKVKWGAGWCQKTAEELKQLIAEVDVKLYINGTQVQKEIISRQYEFYPNNKKQYCYTWLVQLSNWKPGATVFLVSKDGAESLYEATINVKQNGT
jgi:hypothetical protein